MTGSLRFRAKIRDPIDKGGERSALTRVDGAHYPAHVPIERRRSASP
jgi:hypothetical protein